MNFNQKKKIAENLLKIRFFEEKLDPLFQNQKIFGTFHRCIGQEATAISFTHFLDKNEDYVVSNHRNHGHYLAFKKNFNALLNELKGKSNGASGGKGGSQVICDENFLSNGILGSTVALAAGIAFGIKQEKKRNCVLCFMGDGALGPGIVYESLNISSLFKLPIIFVLEKNDVAQTSAIKDITAGSIEQRFKSFNIKTIKIKSSNVYYLLKKTKKIIDFTKQKSQPMAVVIEAKRLCAHSKGDDYRNLKISNTDEPLFFLKKELGLSEFKKIKDQASNYINKLVQDEINGKKS